jgi:hypothetical protein
VAWYGSHNPFGLIVAALVLALAAVVLQGGRQNRVNRLAALVLYMEAVLVGSGSLYAFDPNGPAWLYLFSGSLFVLLTAVYPRLISTLETPLARPFRGRRGLMICTVYAIVVVPASVLGGLADVDGAPSWTQTLKPLAGGIATIGVFAGVIALGLYSVLAAVSAFRRAPSGSPQRKRSKSWLIAFGTRDAFWVLHMAAVLVIVLMYGETAPAADEIWIWGPPAYLLVYAGLLAYGILRAQLFDLDLKIKWGISRGTSATILVVAALVASKIAEAYVTREVSYVAGGIVAGLLLFVVPRLNKIGDKIAQKAIPQATNTSQYIAFRKLEVFQAALQSAMESGGITPKERETLSRLRSKLGISEADAAQVEAELPPLSPDAA